MLLATILTLTRYCGDDDACQVKPVRDSVAEALQLWKTIPDVGACPVPPSAGGDARGTRAITTLLHAHPKNCFFSFFSAFIHVKFHLGAGKLVCRQEWNEEIIVNAKILELAVNDSCCYSFCGFDWILFVKGELDPTVQIFHRQFRL
jgi:hypothetical protein